MGCPGKNQIDCMQGKHSPTLYCSHHRLYSGLTPGRPRVTLNYAKDRAGIGRVQGLNLSTMAPWGEKALVPPGPQSWRTVLSCLPLNCALFSLSQHSPPEADGLSRGGQEASLFLLAGTPACEQNFKDSRRCTPSNTAAPLSKPGFRHMQPYLCVSGRGQKGVGAGGGGGECNVSPHNYQCGKILGPKGT